MHRRLPCMGEKKSRVAAPDTPALAASQPGASRKLRRLASALSMSQLNQHALDASNATAEGQELSNSGEDVAVEEAPRR